MRTYIGLALLLTGIFTGSSVVNADPPIVRTPLKVILYPLVPAKDAYFRQVEAAFEERYPTIDLQLVDLSANYYDEDSPDAVTNTFADVIELDSVFLEDFVATGRVRELPGAAIRPAGTFLSVAEQAVTLKGKMYGVPHWVCSNFLFSTAADPSSAKSLQDLRREIGEPHKVDKGLLIDLKGRSTLGEWYLDSLLDRHKSLQAASAFLSESTADKAVYADLINIRALCDSDLCRHDRYHNAPGFYPVQFARHRGRILAGYSEGLYYIGMEDLTKCREGECLSLGQIKIGPLPLSDAGSQSFAWVDSFVVARSCSGGCLSAAEAFLTFMSDASNVRDTLIPGYSEAPRYLLPALKSLYADGALLAVAPLYATFYPLIEKAIPVRTRHLNQQLRAIGSTLDRSVLPK
ncbi:MAG: hypothetical protein WC241_05340 [Candidatus Paceibacterota bacterium]